MGWGKPTCGLQEPGETQTDADELGGLPEILDSVPFPPVQKKSNCIKSCAWTSVHGWAGGRNGLQFPQRCCLFGISFKCLKSYLVLWYFMEPIISFRKSQSKIKDAGAGQMMTYIRCLHLSSLSFPSLGSNINVGSRVLIASRQAGSSCSATTTAAPSFLFEGKTGSTGLIVISIFTALSTKNHVVGKCSRSLFDFKHWWYLVADMRCFWTQGVWQNIKATNITGPFLTKIHPVQFSYVLISTTVTLVGDFSFCALINRVIEELVPSVGVGIPI